jgi:hypothetical protein
MERTTENIRLNAERKREVGLLTLPPSVLTMGSGSLMNPSAISLIET